MKTRKHINEIFLEALAEWLRKQDREADAKIIDGIDPTTFVRSGYKSNNIYGSSGNPNKGNGGKVTINQLGYTAQVTKRTGEVMNGRVLSLADFVAQIPPEIRPKFIGDLGSSSSTVWDPTSVGLDMGRPGCRCFGQMGANGHAFIVVVGSDEDSTDPAVIEKYLPFTFGFTKSDIFAGSAYGAETYFRNSNNLFNCTFSALVWKSTSPAPEQKPVNQDLPILTYSTPTNKAPSARYRKVPALNLTVDWEVLRGKYTSKVHYNQLWIDVVEAALRKAGDNYNADLIKRINPETFVPFQIKNDTTNKKYTYLGAQCSTSKLYFESITFNIYQAAADSTRMFLSDFGWVYAPEAGISWKLVADQATATAYTGTDIIAENQFHYFYRHIAKGTKLTKQMLLDSFPFHADGVDYLYQTFTDTLTKASANFYNELQENMWTGSSTISVNVVADLV
ncbi:hypothetical protein JOAD_210 [Erwinia phage vB_EamM_Joad]|uniref:Uncharacterized protein n=1 Tax=Erwinia phage vB_EamM_Joad TaxID=2026081 RepID=A0A223LIA8_9CAUD|nr:hypothetical protein JOAD_210 [Erwinia phage vB_EamM_Joad]